MLGQLEELQRYRHAYLAATTELASLIGLPAGAPITLADADMDEPVVPLLIEVEALETETLRSRPELFEKDLEEVISRDEVRVALAEMFPSVSLFWRHDENRNKFLSFAQWSCVRIATAIAVRRFITSSVRNLTASRYLI